MDKRLYEESIILIGPSGAGKSTVASELQKRLICQDYVWIELQIGQEKQVLDVGLKVLMSLIII